MTQCTHVPTGASGSSAMRAKLLVFEGAFVHCSGGDTSLPSQVYFAGMGWPSANAALVIWMLMIFGGLLLSAQLAVSRQPNRAMANHKFIRAFMARFYSAIVGVQASACSDSAARWVCGEMHQAAGKEDRGLRF